MKTIKVFYFLSAFYSVGFMVFTVLNHEIKGKHNYDILISLIIPSIVLAISLVLLYRIIKINSSISYNLAISISAVIFSSIITILYPIFPSVNDAIFDRKNVVQEEIYEKAQKIEELASSSLDSGDFISFSEGFLDSNFDDGGRLSDYNIRFYANHPLNENIRLAKQENIYSYETFPVTVGPWGVPSANFPMNFEFSPTSDFFDENGNPKTSVVIELNDPEIIGNSQQVFLNLWVGTRYSECFVKQVLINDEVIKNEEICSVPDEMILVSAPINLKTITGEVESVKLRILFDDTDLPAGKDTIRAVSESYIRYDNDDRGRIGSSYCFEISHKDNPDLTLMTKKSESPQEGKCRDE